MARYGVGWAVGCMLTASVAAFAQAPAPSPAELAALMKPHLIDALPPVLYEHQRNWGKTSRVAHAIHWHGLRPEIHKTPRNDGHWQKIRISPRQLPSTLDFRLYDFRKIDAERQAFRVFLSFMATVEFEQQLWESGVRLYSGSTRARVRLMAWLDAENTFRLDAGKSFLPDLVFRVRVTQAKVACNDFVVEHTAGVGGTAARLLGEAIEGLLKEANPGLERRLLDRTSAGIVKAADTREVRIGFGSLFEPKAKAAASARR